MKDVQNCNECDWLENYCKNSNFIASANALLPCWTGIFTCFMMRQSKAYDILNGGNLVTEINQILMPDSNFKKVINIPFSLEFIDKWLDIEQICKKEGETKNSERLQEPTSHSEAYDPYDCVPVPNTMYCHTGEGRTFRQGLCMISTIRNLLCIFCRKSRESFQCQVNDNLKENVKKYLNEIDVYSVPGTTSLAVLK